MSVRLANTSHYHACIAPSVWGVLFVLPTSHEWANTRLDGESGSALHVRASGRHRRRR